MQELDEWDDWGSQNTVTLRSAPVLIPRTPTSSQAPSNTRQSPSCAPKTPPTRSGCDFSSIPRAPAFTPRPSLDPAQQTTAQDLWAALDGLAHGENIEVNAQRFLSTRSRLLLVTSGAPFGQFLGTLNVVRSGRLMMGVIMCLFADVYTSSKLAHALIADRTPLSAHGHVLWARVHRVAGVVFDPMGLSASNSILCPAELALAALARSCRAPAQPLRAAATAATHRLTTVLPAPLPPTLATACIRLSEAVEGRPPALLAGVALGAAGAGDWGLLARVLGGAGAAAVAGAEPEVRKAVVKLLADEIDGHSDHQLTCYVILSSIATNCASVTLSTDLWLHGWLLTLFATELTHKPGTTVGEYMARRVLAEEQSEAELLEAMHCAVVLGITVAAGGIAGECALALVQGGRGVLGEYIATYVSLRTLQGELGGDEAAVLNSALQVLRPSEDDSETEEQTN